MPDTQSAGRLADLADLERRYGGTLTGAEREQAEAALDDASAIVRAHGNPSWGAVVDGRLRPVPAAVKAIVLAVAERRVRNPEGFVSESAGEYSYRMPEQGAVGGSLSKGEQLLIERLSGRSAMRSLETVRAVVLTDRCSGYPYPDPSDQRGLV
ncbi:hypothetical protein AB0K09_32365 [Streptomyces sp. NPDC049577]|uniref:hypothetical protein n=1 Tax=Streptomyces sp. NPDC049577 TaxID=3155153 RepID=UPI00342DF10B